VAKENMPVTGTPQLAYVLLEAKPTEVMASVRMPLNFSMVIDHSGSMSGEKLQNVKEAAKIAIDHMESTDFASLVIFDDSASVVVPSQPVSDRERLKRYVDDIEEGGGTEMSKGMTLGLEEAKKALSAELVSRILLLTDGQTYGDERECEMKAKESGSLGIPITALGIGDDWNEKLLDSIAERSGGRSDYIAAPSQIIQEFQTTVQSMQTTVIRNAVMTLRLSSGITPRDVFRVVPEIAKLQHREVSDRDAVVDLGGLETGQGQSLLVELTVPPKQPGSYRIAQAEVSYDVPVAGVVGEKVKADIVVSFTLDARLAAQVDEKLMAIVERVTPFKLQTRAFEDAAAGNIEGATQKLRAAATRLLDMGEADLADTALQEAEALERTGAMSPGGTKKLQYRTRKLTRKLEES